VVEIAQNKGGTPQTLAQQLQMQSQMTEALMAKFGIHYKTLEYIVNIQEKKVKVITEISCEKDREWVCEKLIEDLVVEQEKQKEEDKNA